MSGAREHLHRFKSPLVVNTALLLTIVLSSAWAWSQLPPDAKVPIHWNASGQVDGYGSKLQALGMMPVVLAGVSGLFLVLPLLEPRKQNLLNSSKAYNAIWISLGLMLTLVHFAVVANALGIPVKVHAISMALLGLMLVVMGNYISKVRSNFFLGIRTPWTLSSDLAWAKTHRLGGRLFLLLGIGCTLMAMVNAAIATAAVTAGAVIVTGSTIGYSYLFWSNDPKRQTASG